MVSGSHSKTQHDFVLVALTRHYMLHGDVRYTANADALLRINCSTSFPTSQKISTHKQPNTALNPTTEQATECNHDPTVALPIYNQTPATRTPSLHPITIPTSFKFTTYHRSNSPHPPRTHQRRKSHALVGNHQRTHGHPLRRRTMETLDPHSTKLPPVSARRQVRHQNLSSERQLCCWCFLFPCGKV